MAFDFGNFLDQMNAQSGTKMSLPSSKEIMENKKPNTPPPAPKAEPKSVPQQQVAQPKKTEKSSDDAVERIYEATSVILKTIRKSFPDANERRMMYESIQNAIGLALNDGSSPQYQPQQQMSLSSMIPQGRKPMPQPSQNAPIIPRVNMSLEGQTYTAGELNEMKEIPADNYSRAIDIKPNQGLTNVSERDLADLKALAGITK